VHVDTNIRYVILNFVTVFQALSNYVVCKTCKTDVWFTESSARGLGFKIVNCRNCVPKAIASSPYINNAYEINRRFIFAMRLLGIGLAGAEKLCAFLDLHRPIFKSFYNSIMRNINVASEAVRLMSTQKAAKKEKQLTMEALIHYME
jgi:hypothetical protein